MSNSIAAFMVIETAFTSQGTERRCEVIEPGQEQSTLRWYREVEYDRLAQSHTEYKRRFVTESLIERIKGSDYLPDSCWTQNSRDLVGLEAWGVIEGPIGLDGRSTTKEA